MLLRICNTFLICLFRFYLEFCGPLSWGHLWFSCYCMCGVESSRMPVSTYMASLIWRFAGSQCSFSSSVVSILFLVNDDSYQLNAGILLAMGHASFRCSFWFRNCARSHWYYSWTSILFLGCVASACHWAKHIEDATMVVSFKCWWCHITFQQITLPLFLCMCTLKHFNLAYTHKYTSQTHRVIQWRRKQNG